MQDYDIDNFEPTIDTEYINHLRKIVNNTGNVILAILDPPPTPQGDMYAIITCHKFKKNNADKVLKRMEGQISNAEPFGCGYFLTFGLPLAIDFIMLLLIWGIFNAPHR